jgi:hypothetical protein
MGWGSIQQSLAHTNDLLRFANDVTKGKDLTESAMNLFGNNLATMNAASLRNATGSSLGYMGKYAAGDNAGQAVMNTANASMYTASMLAPPMFGFGYGMNTGFFPAQGYQRMMNTATGMSTFNHPFFMSGGGFYC